MLFQRLLDMVNSYLNKGKCFFLALRWYLQNGRICSNTFLPANTGTWLQQMNIKIIEVCISKQKHEHTYTFFLYSIVYGMNALFIWKEILKLSRHVSRIQKKLWAARLSNAYSAFCVLFSPPILRFVLFYLSSRNRLANSRPRPAIDTTRHRIIKMICSLAGSGGDPCVDTLAC
jgi:hypothetical protein